MKITARATAPMDQEFEMTITMTLAQWQTLANQIHKGGEWYFGPAGRLIEGIRAIESQATQRFKETIEKH